MSKAFWSSLFRKYQLFSKRIQKSEFVTKAKGEEAKGYWKGFPLYSFQLSASRSVFKVWIRTEVFAELLGMGPFKSEHFCHVEHLTAPFPLRPPDFQINRHVKLGIKTKWVTSFLEKVMPQLCVRHTAVGSWRLRWFLLFLCMPSRQTASGWILSKI